jgi:hypothetical protein
MICGLELRVELAVRNAMCIVTIVLVSRHIAIINGRQSDTRCTQGICGDGARTLGGPCRRSGISIARLPLVVFSDGRIAFPGKSSMAQLEDCSTQRDKEGEVVGSVHVFHSF